MARPLVVLALGLSLGLAGCVRGTGTAKEPYVGELVFQGVSAVDREDLASKLATQGPTRRPGVAGLVVKDRERLDPDALATDRRRVEAYYRERGFYDARVTDVSVEPTDEEGLVKVVLRVDEGRPVRVANVAVRGLDEAPDAAKRALPLPLRPGDVFTEGAYDASRAALEEALRETGWATGEVKQSAVVLPEDGTAEVTYEVKAGPRFRFGPIFVAGTSSVPRDRIRSEAETAIKTGEWWDESRLARAQARVFGLGVFGGVRVTRGSPDPKHGTIPVVVAVREAPFRTLRFGPGLAFEKTRWDVQGMVGWQHRNFRGGLRRLGAELRAGYTWVPTPLNPIKDGPTGLATIEFQQPRVLGPRIDATVRLELERGILEAYDFVSERLRLGLPLRLGGGWSFVPSYNLEVYQLSNTTVDALEVAAAENPLLANCEGDVCLLSYLEQRIGWDGRDNPLNTRRGWYVTLAVQEGFELRSYGYRYLRLLPEVRAFYPLSRSLVLALRARLGALVPVREEGLPPIPSRFMAGGPLSMRGYYTNRLSPMVQQNGEWVPVGGNGMSDGSVELRWDISGSIGAAVFLDAGTVSDAAASDTEWKTALDPTRLQFATGLGLRYRTPFGPLRVDVGVRLPETFQGDFDDWFPPVPYARVVSEDGTTLVLVDHREPIIAIHIALGEAF